MTTEAVVPTPAVRPATEGDISSIVTMADAAAASLNESRGGKLMLLREAPPPNADQIRTWLDAGDMAVRVGTLDDVPVAAAVARVEQLTEDTRLAVVTMLWVDEEARGVSVGEALLADLVVWARDAGCESIDAYALPGERVTKNFFEAAGFKARLLTVSHRLDDAST